MKKTILTIAAVAAMMVASVSFADDYLAENGHLVGEQRFAPGNVQNEAVSENALRIVQVKVTDNWFDTSVFDDGQVFVVRNAPTQIKLSAADENCASCHNKNSNQLQVSTPPEKAAGDKALAMGAAILWDSLSPG